MKVLSLATRMGEPRYAQAQSVNYWFWERGYEVVSFTRPGLLSGQLDQDLLQNPEEIIVYGAVAVVRDALVRARRPQPPNLDFPSGLGPFFGRRIGEATMGDIREWERSGSERLPCHIKPRDRHKLFKGQVVETFRDFLPLSGVSDEEPVIVQDLVELASEWRATVLRGEIINVAHYKGDPLVFPCRQTVIEGLRAFQNQPIACGMDWGITTDGRTILVEVNDGFALGNYGVRGHQYTAVIECRWRELMGLSDNGVGCEV